MEHLTHSSRIEPITTTSETALPPLFQTLAEARARLTAAGLRADAAAADVDVLARAALGWDRARLIARARDPTPAALQPRFDEWLSRRERREPTAYIVGRREFWGLDFHVTADVLIPRPESELIVEEARLLVRDAGSGHVHDTPLRLADIGTGSGCLAIALACEMPGARVTATDVSAAALAVARENALRHGVSARIDWVETTFLQGITGTFDVIVANPPYVAEANRDALSPEVRCEPAVALFGGGAGLDHLAEVVKTAVGSLTPGGWLIMEFGLGQDDAVTDLIAAQPSLRLDRIRGDLQGIPRTAVAQRRFS